MVGEGPQYPDRHALGGARHEGDATVCKGTDRAAARPLLSQNTPTTAALLQQTRTVPVIFANIADPVGSGFIASLLRPGSNVTGFVLSEPTMAGKWLELLKEIAPRVKRAALLFNPTTAPHAEYFLKPFKAAALSSRVEAITATAHDMSQLETVIAAQAREPDGGLIVMPDSFLNVHRVDVTSLAAHYHLPAIYPYRFYTEVGGLLSYGKMIWFCSRDIAWLLHLRSRGRQRRPFL
jgi:putative ABC transport system substrate-binding protein